MFVIIENSLRALPNSIKLNGVTYTDLHNQSESALNNLGIYTLPAPPSYDGENFKLSVNYETKQWEILALTENERSEVIRKNYLREFTKLEGKYYSYLKLRDLNQNNPKVLAQIEEYIVGLTDYMSRVFNQEIPFNEIKEYGECMIRSDSNTL
tara:strand:+ start:203 stop:661 length:459 start_codon:yes stop_codon:yes gene_type:complete